MPKYHYKAVSPDGEVVEGEMEGVDEAAVIAHIQSIGQIPIRAAEVKTGLRGLRLPRKRSAKRKISHNEVLIFTRELASLLQSNVALDRTLQIMLETSDEGQMSKLVADIQQSIRGGASLSAALEEQSGVFSKFYINMVKAAEVGGATDMGLVKLEEYLEKNKALKDKVISALVYPTILLIVSGISVLLILTYVVPQFTELFSDLGKTLPLSTRVVLAISDGLQTYGWMFVIAILVISGYVKQQLTKRTVRLRWDRFILRIPILGTLIRNLETARFSRSLGTLLTDGVPILNGMTIAKETMSNTILADSLDMAHTSLKEGNSLVEPLLATKMFPKLALQMLRVGEETGHLDEMLLRVADIYDREFEQTVQRLLTILEPVLIVSMGIIVAGIIMSMLVAIVSINELPV